MANSNPSIHGGRPEKQLDGFLAKYLPEIVSVARSALDRMRARLPGAIEMVYDNYNGLVIGFCPTERPSDAIFSLVLYPRWVTLCFLQGAGLPDPNGLLRGKGKIVRHIVLEEAEDLDKPEVQDLITTALERARTPLEETVPGRLIIKSVSATQRPLRVRELDQLPRHHRDKARLTAIVDRSAPVNLRGYASGVSPRRRNVARMR